MIKYALKCGDGHTFDSWFQDSAAYDKLAAAGHLSCAVCGGSDVTKSIMAPRVSTSEDEPDAPLSQPASPAEQALRRLREHVEANAENVGTGFAREARAMHDGDKPHRPIYGEAKLEEAKSLLEDGVPVAPLPWGRTKTN